ncbi:refilin-A [Thalassophryne amazonica]|uniref:refilin-A n=1 Tax=Thalassophryne amazonica TaxID=390379 RepID=UPI001471BCC3|nr:refilin-A [Thalassophryne amazonica]XP_034025530.1 refilin-A [Thalassophryne amazonica]
MVGHLHLQAMDESLKAKSRDGLLDSPDSGLPPSPSPPFCSLSPGLTEARTDSQHAWTRKESREGKLLPYLLLNATGTDVRTRMHPVFFGESIEVNPKPEQEIKCNSEVKYDSDRHYRDRVYCVSRPTATSYSETVVAVQNCTWRSYRSEVHLEPRQRPLSYQSTTIIYPKHTKNIYRTTLKYNATGARRWFVSTVQLESNEDPSPCIIFTEDL